MFFFYDPSWSESNFILFLFFIRSELVRVDPSWSDPDWRSELIRSDFCTCLILCGIQDLQKSKNNNNKKFSKDVVYKEVFLRLQLNWLLFFHFFFVLTLGPRGLPESLNGLFKIDFVWSNKHQGDLRTDYIIRWGTSL